MSHLARSILTRARPNIPSAIASQRLSSIRSQLSPPVRTMSSQPHIPETMKAVQIDETGGPEVLKVKTDVPVPRPKEGQILVKNEYIGVNYIDTYASPPLPLAYVLT